MLARCNCTEHWVPLESDGTLKKIGELLAEGERIKRFIVEQVVADDEWSVNAAVRLTGKASTLGCELKELESKYEHPNFSDT